MLSFKQNYRSSVLLDKTFHERKLMLLYFNEKSFGTSFKFHSDFLFKHEQEMASWQQKSAKKRSERYLMFGLNHNLVTLRWDDGHSPCHENVCQRFLNGYK